LGRLLPDLTTAVSMRDRLLHHCHTVVTDGDSYRMKVVRRETIDCRCAQVDSKQ
jgi:DNA replication protein DnaC